MNREAIGAAAELIGACAVVAMLRYLAMQIRQHNAGQRIALSQIAPHFLELLSPGLAAKHLMALFLAVAILPGALAGAPDDDRYTFAGGPLLVRPQEGAALALVVRGRALGGRMRVEILVDGEVWKQFSLDEARPARRLSGKIGGVPLIAHCATAFAEMVTSANGEGRWRYPVGGAVAECDFTFDGEDAGLIRGSVLVK